MSLKIIFMGTPSFALPILKAINESQHKLLAVYTQPPKKKFRGLKMVETPIHQFAKKINKPIRLPESLNSVEEFNFIKKLNPNIVVVVAYGQIIPKKILDLTGITFINIHASILPKWRGAAPIQRAIMNGDKETGISVMKIINKLDAGPIMKIVKLKITPECNFETLSKKMSLIASSTILDVLTILQKKGEIYLPQDDSKATYAKKIDKKESKISWDNDAEKIIAKINALYSNPGSWFELNGSRIKILKAKLIKKKGKPGEILDDKFTIACKKDSVRIIELQKEGKKSVIATNFLLGNKLTVGEIISVS